MSTDVQRLTAPGSLTDRATEALTRLVASGEYGPGGRLPPELELAARFGVSRTVVREAVARLKSAGLVESRQFTPVVDRTYPLEEIVEAYRYVETQQKIGNVVITVAGDDDRER